MFAIYEVIMCMYDHSVKFLYLDNNRNESDRVYKHSF